MMLRRYSIISCLLTVLISVFSAITSAATIQIDEDLSAQKLGAFDEVTSKQGNSRSVRILKNTTASAEEVNEFNTKFNFTTQPGQFRHRDEDSERAEIALDLEQSLKYEVEVLQPGDQVQREDIEIEERFKRPSLLFNTDKFYDENIEVNGNPIKQSHVIMTILLVVMALLSIGLYAALVIWRSHLEQRYGMRERLVTEDDFCRSDNARHFTVGLM